MSDEYQGSEYHKENYRSFKKARKEGFERFVEKRKKSHLLEYGQNPSDCIFCKKQFEYKDRKKKFCNTSCAAKYNNTLRKGIKYELSEEGRKNIREANARRDKYVGKICKIKITNCSICDKLFVQRSNGKVAKKNCSRECRTIACTGNRTYQNGRKHYQRYFNKWIDKEVLLESSWEKITAEKLDELNIKWERPKFIRWQDSSGKSRLYFPDFYLNDYDVYLDPKNPYCMKQDEEKMKIVAKDINIEFGNIEKIINFIKTM